MDRLNYPARDTRIWIRLRPDELERASILAQHEEVSIPQFIREVLKHKWHESQADGAR